MTELHISNTDNNNPQAGLETDWAFLHPGLSSGYDFTDSHNKHLVTPDVISAIGVVGVESQLLNPGKTEVHAENEAANSVQYSPDNLEYFRALFSDLGSEPVSDESHPAQTKADNQSLHSTPKLTERIHNNFDERLTRLAGRLNMESKEGKRRLAITVGVLGGAALYVAAPDVAGHVFDTLRSHGSNYMTPGVGEWAGVAVAGGVAATQISKLQHKS